MVHHIKVREIGKKRWVFLSPNGVNSLRVHACRFKDKATAQAVIDANQPENPEWQFKVQEA